MESEGSLACSQKLITGAYNEPAEWNPHQHISPASKLILTFCLCLVLPSSLCLCFMSITFYVTYRRSINDAYFTFSHPSIERLSGNINNYTCDVYFTILLVKSILLYYLDHQIWFVSGIWRFR
jgi:Na+/H+ antiporter NhaD/arsenite permease-like protein